LFETNDNCEKRDFGEFEGEEDEEEERDREG
jgi:hypothetical protein